MFLRFIQGLGDSLVSTSGYSIITIEFPIKKQKYIGYCQASVGIGLMMGPVFGQALYSVVQYEWTFYIFAMVLAVAMVVLIFIIPNSINHADDIFSKAEIDQYFEMLKSTERGESTYQPNNNRLLMMSEAKTTSSKDVTYIMFLKNRKAMMSIASAMFAMMFMLFFDGILTMHLISDLDVGENSAGYFFGLICATYALSSPFVAVFLTFISRQWLSFISFGVAAGALLMLGPS